MYRFAIYGPPTYRPAMYEPLTYRLSPNSKEAEVTDVRRPLVVLMLLMTAAGVLLLGVGRAAAVPSTNINAGYAGFACSYGTGGDAYCLWYSQGQAGGVWGSNAPGVGPISGTFGGGGAGSGAAVRNDAASMTDNVTNCHVTTWVYSNYTGPANYLTATEWGNLTSNATFPLRNNEASIDYDSCF